tara:strand:+ start:1437 stop:1622 length:186 start_codon:yes stop_codon:yes gene_type:complete
MGLDIPIEEEQPKNSRRDSQHRRASFFATPQEQYFDNIKKTSGSNNLIKLASRNSKHQSAL